MVSISRPELTRSGIGKRPSMSRGAKLSRPWKQKPNAAAEQLRPQLEDARLDLRALYRSLDQLMLAQQLPAQLRRLQELDADFAEALWVLDQPRGRFDLSAMIDDTLASLGRVAVAREAFLASFDASARAQIEDGTTGIRTVLPPRMRTWRYRVGILRRHEICPGGNASQNRGNHFVTGAGIIKIAASCADSSVA